MPAARKKPWDKPNPKAKSGKPPKRLSASRKSAATRSAEKAGRPYPNLVDNMRAAKKNKKSAS